MPISNPGFNPQTIFDALQRIAQHGIVDSKTGAVHGAERTVGYVAKIHTEGEMAGTVDVQEYIDYDHQADIDSKVGYHEGVYLSAIQNSDCFMIIPKLYSDVVIVRDIATRKEYVSMVSHVDVFKVDAHEELYVGVSERKEFNPDDDVDVDELEATGKTSFSRYTKDSIADSVADKENSKAVTGELTTEGYRVDVNGQTEMKLTDGGMEVSRGQMALKMTETAMEVGGADDNVVLGRQLVQLLSELLTNLTQLTVMCPPTGGPSGPPVNIPAFQSINAKLNTILSQTVKVKK